MLAETVGPRAPEVWAWLRARPFVGQSGDGLHLHDLVRDVSDAEFAHCNPDGYVALHRTMRQHAVRRLLDPAPVSRRRDATELMLLHHRSPLEPVLRPAHDRKERRMCRWLAYTGSPVLLTDVLYTPVHSLIDQSLHSKLGAETTNGDGFGIGWYDAAPTPGVFRSIEPAWNDQNLRELAGHVSSHLFFAHIRAAIGSPVQQTNCHPFRHGRWLWMHNGFIDGFATVKRDLVLAVDESLFPEIKGGTDTEILFHLALTFGLQDDPPDAVARAIGFVEACGRQRGVTSPFQGTIATTDGESLWVFRYSSEGKSRSLFFSRDARTVKQQYPERHALQQLSDDARFVVSEPIGDLPGAWAELPEASYGVVGAGDDQLLPFVPKPPA